MNASIWLYCKLIVSTATMHSINVPAVQLEIKLVNNNRLNGMKQRQKITFLSV